MAKEDKDREIVAAFMSPPGWPPPRKEAIDAAERRGYMLALERVRNFGADLKGDAALSDEERYILPQAAEVLEGEAPGEAE